MLFAALFLCMGAMNAEVTKFYKPGERKATLEAGDKVMFYNTALVLNDAGDDITQDRTGFLVDGGTSLQLDKQKPSAYPLFSEKTGVWTVAAVEDNSTYYKANVTGSNGYVGIGGATNNTEVRDLFFHKWTEVAADKRAGVGSENVAGGIVKNADIAASENLWLVANSGTEISNTWNGNTESFTTWSTGHPYAIYSIVEAETADLEACLAAAKTAAVSGLESLAKLSISNAATAIESVNAVVLANDDLETALNTIDALVEEAKKSIDGKSVVFDNNGSDDREGLSVTATGDKAYGTASEGDETIWTIKSQADGSFKLYNFVTDKYLGEPGDMNLKDEASAAAYNFIVTDVDKVALVNKANNKMLHQATYWGPTNYELLNWYDLNDAASLWTLTEKSIVISREQYDLATAAKAVLPYAIQEAYGLVTDGANYYSNWFETCEGSYAALLDGASDSYFHSAYTDEAKAEDAPAHYIQANLGEGNSVDEFYFYMAPRNANNRPVNVTVSGSNDNEAYTEIATVTTTLESSSSYLSTKLGTKGTNYQYIRLTVTSTNTSTKFFTLSELYFFPATSDVTSLVDSYNAFAASSITETAMADAATALVNAETTLALANIKKEISALLAANASNHADTPALGQYTTAAYNALNTAYTAVGATQESLEAAIAAFKASLNAPVYFITSAHNGYAAGSAIYYDGAWKWKAANKYDRQMWMTIPGYTEENVPTVAAYDAESTSYEICDYLTGTVMRGKKVQIVEIADWTGAYNLQYNANATSTDAVQHAANGGSLVNWKAATTTENQASAWIVEYIGNSYDLKKLTDEHITALAALQTACINKGYAADAEIGNGLGQYQGNKEAIVAVVEDGEAILSKSLTEQAAMTVADIDAAAAAINAAEDLTINLPVEGKYYRFQGACEAELSGYYITGHTNEDGGRIALTAEADASTVYYYADGKLKACASGLYIGLNASHWTFAKDSESASVITFAASPRTTGAYTIKSADRYLHYTVYYGTVQVDRCSEDTDAEHDWYITEVTESALTSIGAKVGDVVIADDKATVESIKTIDVYFDRPVALAEGAGRATIADKWGPANLVAEVLEAEEGSSEYVVRLSVSDEYNGEFTEAGDYALNVPAGFIVSADEANYYVSTEIAATITVEAAPATPLTVTNVTVDDAVVDAAAISVTSANMIKVNFDGEFYTQGDPTIVDAKGDDASSYFTFVSAMSAGLTGNSYIFMAQNWDGVAAPAGTYTITMPKTMFVEYASYKAPAEDVVLTVTVAAESNPDTAIRSVEAETETVIYDLLGRRVEKMEKGGIYIVNGKKVIK